MVNSGLRGIVSIFGARGGNLSPKGFLQILNQEKRLEKTLLMKYTTRKQLNDKETRDIFDDIEIKTVTIKVTVEMME